MARSGARGATAAIATTVLVVLLLESSQGHILPKLCTGVADVLFIVDCSSSIDYFDYLRQLNFSAELTSAFTVGSHGFHFGAMVFSTYVYNIFGFTEHLTNLAVKQAIVNLPYYGGATYTGDALQLARTFSFTGVNGARPDVPHITVVLTDGLSTNVMETSIQAHLLKMSNVTVIVVGVGSGVDVNELNRIASSPGLVYLVDDYGVLGAINSQLATSLCNEQNSTNVTSCISNNGCIGKANGNYRACDPECREGYYYSCSNEYTYRMPCALGWYKSKNGTAFTARLIYNKDTDTCEKEANYCPRDHEKYKVITPKQNNQHNPVNNRPCLGPKDSCAGKPDGNYAKCYPACQDGFYFSCSNNETYTLPCALGSYTDKNKRTFLDRMVYDADFDSCVLSCPSCPRDLFNKPGNNPSPTTVVNGSIPNAVTPDCHGKADILFILDSSGSIGVTNYELMTFFVAELTTHFTVGPDDVLFSALIFSNNVVNLFSFSQFSSRDDVYQALLNATYLDQGTNTALALATANNFSFSSINGARPGVGRLAIVLTDGISNDRNKTAKQAALLKSSNVTIITIGVGASADYDELLAIATSADRIFTVDNFNILDSIKTSLITSACEISVDVTTNCVSDSCLRRADKNYPACNPECKDGHYYSCLSGYAYKMSCPLGRYTHSNGTGFTARMVYNTQTDTCELEAGYCPREPREHAVVAPPPKPRQVNQYNPTCISSQESCLGKQDGNYPMCYPDCQNGFYYSCSNVETYEMPCPLGWYTDGQNQRFLERMIYDPSSDSCELKVDYCPRGANNIRIKPTPAAPINAPDIPQCNAKADVIVVIDSSGSIGSVNFAVQTEFVANLTKHFAVGPDLVRFGAIVFSSNTVLEFGFNTYSDNNALYQAVKSLPYFGGGTDTAAALKLATNVAFSHANGARDNVGKTAIMLTDGISQDPLATALEADRLKQVGVKVISIGIGVAFRYAELLAIASSPQLIYNVSGFEVLNSIAKDVVMSTCQDSAESSCVSGDCGKRSDGTYVACACQDGSYYVCSSGMTINMKCVTMRYQDSDGIFFQAPGVYDPATKSCQDISTACTRDPIDYKLQSP